MINYLKQLDNNKLAEIWCALNCWEYPPELEKFKPDNWELLPIQAKYQVIKFEIKYIKSRVSEKELLREWNKDRYKDIEFDIWWENREPLTDLQFKLLKTLYTLDTCNKN